LLRQYWQTVEGFIILILNRVERKSTVAHAFLRYLIDMFEQV
jgi:hypothetical protein